MHRCSSFAVVIAAICIFAPHARAQRNATIHEGAWLIGGSASLSRTHNDASNSDNSSFFLAPTGLWFATPRLAVGGTAALSYTSLSLGHSTDYGIGPGARYYFGDLSTEYLPFVAASFTPQWQSTHTNSPSTDTNGHVYLTDASLGLTRLLATHVGLTVELYYAHVSAHTDLAPVGVSTGSYSYGVRFGLNAFIR